MTRPLSYEDARGEARSTTVTVEDGRITLLGATFDLVEFRAAVEMEAFANGPKLKGGPGTAVGRRKLAA